MESTQSTALTLGNLTPLAIWGIILGILGFSMMFLPYPTWFLLYGWRHRDKEPSDTILVAMRLGGIIFMLVAVVFLCV